MKVFKEPNLSNDWKCPICGTNESKEVVLVAIDGTWDSNIMQSNQYHLDCIELTESNLGFKTVMGMVFIKNKGENNDNQRNKILDLWNYDWTDDCVAWCINNFIIKENKMAIIKEDELYHEKRKIYLKGPSGTAFALLGYAKTFARDLDLDFAKISEEMKSSDYENLIQVFDKYFGDYVDLIQ